MWRGCSEEERVRKKGKGEMRRMEMRLKATRVLLRLALARTCT